MNAQVIPLFTHPHATRAPSAHRAEARRLTRPKPKLVAAAAPEPPVIVWLRLQDGFRALKTRHEGEVAALDARHHQERADALAKIGAFERDNPGLAEDAKRQLEHLASKPALGSAQ